MKRTILIFIIHCSLFTIYCEAQMGQWTWMNGSNTTDPVGVFGTQTVFAPGNTPPGLYEACQWTDQQGNFWLFGGGEGSPLYGDLWKFDPVANEWAWMKGPGVPSQAGVYGTINVPSATNNPGGRGFAELSWVDNNNNLWMYGGYGYDANALYSNLGDLWEYNIATNMWTWVNGSDLGNPMIVYGTEGIPAPGNTPGGRCESNATWVDDNNNLWLYGGYGGLGDLWMYNIGTNEWAWMSGSNTANAIPVYGSKGVPAPANFPGGRQCYAAWKSISDDFWLFGGGSSDYNDMWRYNIATNEWTWMSGTNVTSSPGNSGSNCVPDTGYFPSGRYENRACWTLGCDNFVNYGSTTNDMWNYSVSTGQWTCLNGTANVSGNANWGTIHVSSPTNTPGNRWGSIGFKDLAGNLWLFGADLANYYNDMWKFVVDTTCPHAAGVSVTSAFNASPLNGCTPMTVTFNNTSVNGTSFLWNFGDTTTSTSMNPTHTYTDTGYFSVTLIAVNNSACGSGADTTIHTDYIHVAPSAHIAFQAIPLSGCSPLNVQFTSDSAVAVTSYLWNFGDGGTSQSISPSHTYFNHGTYEVTLIGYSSNGCNDTVHLNSIVVDTIPIVTTAFSASPLSGCNPLTVTFTNSTTNGHNYLWNFGDNISTDTTANPTHTYTQPGTYTVTLISIDSSACGVGIDTLIHTAYIVVNAVAVAQFIPDSVLGCVPFNVSFTNSSTHATSYLWSFGDTHTSTAVNPTNTYTQAGAYTVTLIAFGAGGCNDTIQKSYISVINPPVVTSPFISDTFQGCNPLTINFTNNGSDATNYLWRFGDGGSATTFNATHTYTDSGVFTVTLVMTNDTSICGLYTDSTVKSEYILVANPIIVTSNFTVSPLTGCTPLIVTITNNSTNGADYYWNFGNGQSSFGNNPPPVIYLDSGTYIISLLATNYNSRCYNAPDSMSITIDVDSCNIYIPNTFSPNGDGKNDLFELNTEGYSNYHLIIFDRWGLKVFESNSTSNLWNGKLNNTGGQCPDGTYYYIFTANDFYDTPFANHGFLTLIR